MGEISELEKLYLPSRWSKRYSSEEILDNFFQTISTLSENVRKSIPNQLDVPYGSLEKEKFDIYGTDLPKDSPVFIFIHGGYWQAEEVHKNNSCYIANSLYKNKWKVIVVGYTHCPSATVPQIIEEIKSAVTKCIAYAQANGVRSIVIGGHSVGAHLTVSLFPSFYNSLSQDQRNLIKAVFLISGIYDLIPIITTTINNPLKLNFDLAQELSPLYENFQSIMDTSTKFYVIVGENDSPAFVKQSELFSNTLSSQGIQCYLQVLKEYDHFDITEKLYNDDYVITKLILGSIM